MNWTWFHKLGSPKWFYAISGRLLPWLSIAAVLLITCGAVWGLAFAPPDYQQGNSFRIIYIHVPAAMLAQSCYVMLAVCGVVGLFCHADGDRNFNSRHYRRRGRCHTIHAVWWPICDGL